MSFRAMASELPFCLQFQLERSLLGTSSNQMSIRSKKRPRDAAERHERVQTIRMTALKRILVYIRLVLPPLLESVEITMLKNPKSQTYWELFANDLYGKLESIKSAIEKGSLHGLLDQWRQDLQSARDRAQSQLLCALHNIIDTTVELDEEAKLNADSLTFDVIQKRSQWPMAEYRAKIQVYTKADDGRKFDGAYLLPTDYQMINLQACENQNGNSGLGDTSRRAIREEGWCVRDRFVLMSSVKFDNLYNHKLEGFLASQPSLCNRRYVYLFDKGTGKPNVWLYSEPTPGRGPSRQELLSTIGSLKDVTPTKLGDRISLAFTQTRPICELQQSQILAIDEIIRNNYPFSDGCGVFGIDIAKRVQEVYQLPDIPGAIQIRMGGVKVRCRFGLEFSNCVALR